MNNRPVFCGDPVFNYTWLEEGKILAGSIPYYSRNLDTLKAMGIQVILSLTRRDITTYPDMLRVAFDFGFIHKPMPDSGVPSDEIAISCIQTIDNATLRNLPIYIHCRGGVGRTGIILGAYYHLMRGLPLDEAIQFVRKRVNVYGFTAEAQTETQREWIKNCGGLSWQSH